MVTFPIPTLLSYVGWVIFVICGETGVYVQVYVVSDVTKTVIYKLLVFGHRNLIKKIKHTAVINILKTFIL